MNVIELPQHMAFLAAGPSTQRINDVAERFQTGGTQVSGTQIFVFCIVAVVLGIVLWRVARLVALRDGRSYVSTKRLFRDLCRLHDLDWSSRRLLRRLALARGLNNPAQIFLQPAWLEPAEIPAEFRPFQAQLQEIEQRLFADGR